MNTAEALAIVQFVQEACPAQKFSEYTPDIWTELLADIDARDARTACVTLAKRQPFIGPHDIRGEVSRIRSERIRADFSEPEYDGHDVQAGLEAIRERRHALGNGDTTPPPAVDGPRKRDVLDLMQRTVDRLPKIPNVSRGVVS